MTLSRGRCDDYSPTEGGRHLRGGRVLQGSFLAGEAEFLDCAEKLLDLAEDAGLLCS